MQWSWILNRKETARTVGTDGISHIVAVIHSSSSEVMTLRTAGQYLQKSHTHGPVPQQLYLIIKKKKMNAKIRSTKHGQLFSSFFILVSNWKAPTFLMLEWINTVAYLRKGTLSHWEIRQVTSIDNSMEKSIRGRHWLIMREIQLRLPVFLGFLEMCV